MSSIQWTDVTWNPVRGCSRVSAGCQNCYAERQANRMSGAGGAYEGLVENGPHGPRWTGKVVTAPDSVLTQPLRWRNPRRVFVNSMSDLFHESLPCAAIDRVFAVMALAQRHTFQVLTKRPERAREYLAFGNGYRDRCDAIGRAVLDLDDDHVLLSHALPLPNVWLGVSVEDQATADERIPILLDTPAAVRFVSYEPALGPVDFRRRWTGPFNPSEYGSVPPNTLDWIICGGESGPGARPFEINWARQVIADCRTAGVPCFMKQVGSNPHFDRDDTTSYFRDRKGGDMSEWTEDLRVREYPA